MSAVDEAIEGTAVEVGTDLVAQQAPPTLFRTDDPVEVIARASRVADALKSVLRQQALTQNIQGKEYVRVEGWTTLGSMLGVVPVCVWTREVDQGWEARVEARTLDGRTIGAAEAQCTRDEQTWRSRDPYALRSMAQTRATSKALRGPLGFIVTLAGYEATPSEEMPAAPSPGPQQAAQPQQVAQAAEAADEQIAGLLARKGQLQAKRRQADEGMRALGAGPEQRLRELLNANTSEKLDQLITRVGNALDGTGS